MKVRKINGLSERKRDGIFEHVFSNKDREVAGVLIGEHFEDGSLWIADHIPAEEADEQAAAVTFTHESWDRILKIKDTDFADLEIVGWYHSHPGYGLFLSNDDMFLHRNFFPAWWQIAYVVDPVNEEGGIFVWQESEEESEEEDSNMEMFERHEATFGPSGPSALLAKGTESLPVRPVREKLPERLRPEGMLGLVLAVAGVFVLVVILGFVLLGSGGSDEEAATVLPVEPTAAPPPSAEGQSREFEDQFPSDAKKEEYVPVAPPAAPSKGSATSTAGSGSSAPAPAPSPAPPSSGGGGGSGGGSGGGGGVRP